MRLIEQLQKTVVEKDVENAWRAFLSKYYECDIVSPFKTDGYFEYVDARVLCEFKDDIDMGDTNSILIVVAQSICYIKKFQQDGKPLPNVVFAGDKNECFVLGTAALLPYLAKPYDWSIAPSQAYKYLPLMADLLKDENIIPVVFNLDSKFSFDPVELCIQNTSMQAKSETPITADNIVRVFEYWVGNVLYDSAKMEPADVLDTFLMLLCQPQECYLHPKKPQFLLIGGREVRVKSKMYKAFFTLYKETHNPLELRYITANKDRLLQEIHRRRTGAFFTPSLWVDEAHKMIAEQFGEDWRDKYIVWDCSCGTCNLTRDYKFKELYCSTLDQSDIDLANQSGYNPEAVKFQFDFLNDDESKLPEGLRKALAENKPILFFNNPPYGTAQNLGRDGDSKSDISIGTGVYRQMDAQKIGGASQNLYAQFMFKISTMMKSNGVMATFSKANFLTGKQCEGFRKSVLSRMILKDGMLFQASHFSDVADAWGVAYTIFVLGTPTDYILKVKDISEETGKIIVVGEKPFWSPTHRAGQWVRTSNAGNKIEAPILKNSCSVVQKGYNTYTDDAIGMFHSAGNDIGQNFQKVALFSTAYCGAGSCTINFENVWRCIALFSARKLIVGNWINDKDEYMVPDVNHPEYQQWLNDCLVYSLFNTSSNQSSLRQVEYKGKKWDIVNHFFFMSAGEIEQLAVTHNNNEVYNDIKQNGGDRFVYTQLESIALSPDAKNVLEMARELVRKSFSLRDACNNVNPEFHINTWDAGWYQIKNGLLKSHFKADYDEFVAEYKKLEERLREGVYTFGFLRK